MRIRLRSAASTAVMAAAALVLMLAALALVSCQSADNAAAQRANAEANLEIARAEAYTRRVAADESRRENGHQRALEMLPFVIIILGGLLLAGFGAFIVWDRSRHSQAAQVDPALLIYLEQQWLDQIERDQHLWRAIAHLDRSLGVDRVSLPAGDTKGTEVDFELG